jgi:NAD(P)-dependent dehydrogenase (short-subunit alcohol dehydrogenase family)
MDLNDAVVIVTGGAGGIGAAMSTRFVAEGATVVVTDIDAAAAQALATEIGATAAGLDVTDEAALLALVSEVRERHGRIDLFCSNAGIATGVGIEGPLELWQQAMDINVMSHVYAARAVLPIMIEQGHGYLLQTCSAAGLLTAPGDAPYSVSKHAAVALGEWLAIHYAQLGIKVSVLCPMGVATPMLMNPLAEGNWSAGAVASSAPVIAPEVVADVVVAGLADERFLMLPHPEVGRFWAKKAADPDRWIDGMTTAFGTAYTRDRDAVTGG